MIIHSNGPLAWVICLNKIYNIIKKNTKYVAKYVICCPNLNIENI